MQIKEAGHMVPMDQPAVALHMLNDFLENKLPSHRLSPPEHISLEASEQFEASEQYVLVDDQPLEIDIVL
ncbi:hypothetical protein FOZ61_003126 [Perkinsus olseni]|uniref:Uncharacterized protein n=2 Tax=Perkinsus olseni TaxID=32597 RepID=A0A7J6KM38_PEROL|nr:hypothetical protein FOZ61_003126 [Perkinsus olseni]